MLNKISTYFSNSKKRIFDQLLEGKSYSSSNGLCCVSIFPENLFLVYAHEINQKAIIEVCESHPCKNPNEFSQTLTAAVKNNHLKNVSCSLMLQPEDYQLLVTDALPVKPSEFQDAIRWKIKDLLRFPLNDVVIDSFSFPKMKNNQNKIMIVAASGSKLKRMSDHIHNCNLNLKFIDIPELGLRNISVLYEDHNVVALVFVQNKNIQLLITAQQEIYVSRQLKFSLNTEDLDMTEQSIERLASEMRRSFDYYQSLWDKPLPSRVIFASTKLIDQNGINLLSQKLILPVEIINLKDKLEFKTKTNADQNKYLPTIGGVLRESKPNEARD